MQGNVVRILASVAAAAIGLGLALWVTRPQSPPPQPAPRVPSRDDVTLCAQRLVKLGRALRLYADDNDGAFPIGDTPADADVWLPKRLKEQHVTAADLRCPAAGAEGPPYVYHCYRRLGVGNWPRWMAEKHVVDEDSDPGAWLSADAIDREAPGPHSPTEKAFNYLTADGRVTFQVGRPREVYK